MPARSILPLNTKVFVFGEIGRWSNVLENATIFIMKLGFLLSHKRAQDMRQIDWPSGLSMLVLAPHPDDFDSIGVTLKYLCKSGHNLHAAIIVTGSGIDDIDGAGMSIRDREKLREREQANSLHFFGLPETDYQFLNMDNADDEQLINNEKNRRLVMEIVRQVKPDLIFMPHENDTNRAHRAMVELASQVVEKLDWPIALMLNRDNKTLDMKTDLYLAFDEEEAEWKRKLLRFHNSQQQRNLRSRGYGFDDRVLSQDRANAQELQISQPYAEVYEMRLILKKILI